MKVVDLNKYKEQRYLEEFSEEDFDEFDLMLGIAKDDIDSILRCDEFTDTEKVTYLQIMKMMCEEILEE